MYTETKSKRLAKFRPDITTDLRRECPDQCSSNLRYKTPAWEGGCLVTVLWAPFGSPVWGISDQPQSDADKLGAGPQTTLRNSCLH